PHATPGQTSRSARRGATMTENRAVLLGRFVDGELEPDEVERLTHELTQDLEGAAYVERLRRLRALAQSTPDASRPSDQALVFNFEQQQRSLWPLVFVGGAGLPLGLLGALVILAIQEFKLAPSRPSPFLPVSPAPTSPQAIAPPPGATRPPAP